MNPIDSNATYNPIHTSPLRTMPMPEEQPNQQELVTSFKQTTSKLVVNKQLKQNPKDTCSTILNIGKNVNNKSFIPSQFPNLTNIKTINLNSVNPTNPRTNTTNTDYSQQLMNAIKHNTTVKRTKDKRKEEKREEEKRREEKREKRRKEKKREEKKRDKTRKKLQMPTTYSY